MSKRVSNPVIPDYSPKKKVEPEVSLEFKPCVSCGKAIKEGYYGRYGGGGVCSKVCNAIQAQKTKYPEHTEEEFLRRTCEDMDKDH